MFILSLSHVLIACVSIFSLACGSDPSQPTVQSTSHPTLITSTKATQIHSDNYVNKSPSSNLSEKYEQSDETYAQGVPSLEFVNSFEESLDDRHFVTLEELPMSKKIIERTYQFKRETAKESIAKEDLENLAKIPAPQPLFTNYTASTVYIHYTHQLTGLERLEDTNAKLGDPCRPTNILIPDYCERAAFPNKGKMVCNTVNDKPHELYPHTCVCKYYRLNEQDLRWKQLTVYNMVLNGQKPVNVCMVPEGGVCNHRVTTGIRDKYGRLIFEIDICQGHFQCDNTHLHGYVKHNAPSDGTYLLKKELQLSKHCTEDDFLDLFESKVRDKVLLCAKPHPRRFTNYDEFKYYCLPQVSREKVPRRFKPLPPELDKDDEFVIKPAQTLEDKH